MNLQLPATKYKIVSVLKMKMFRSVLISSGIVNVQSLQVFNWFALMREKVESNEEKPRKTEFKRARWQRVNKKNCRSFCSMNYAMLSGVESVPQRHIQLNVLSTGQHKCGVSKAKVKKHEQRFLEILRNSLETTSHVKRNVCAWA